MKNLIFKFVFFVLLCTLVISSFCGKTICYANSIIPAKSACVIEGNSGKVLYEKNKDQKLAMASTTKIATLIVALENYENLDNIVKVSDLAVGVEGTSIYLDYEEEIRFYDLLVGLMLASGNDCAVAIAEEVCGSEEFVVKMNNMAKVAGAENTNFVNVHGLDADGHYTTAYDLAKITAYGLKNEKFKEICSIKNAIINSTNKRDTRYLKHKNKLLFTEENCIGVKTGFTDNAGRCLVNAHEENDMQIITVLLNCGPMFEVAKQLTELSIEKYVMKEFVSPYTFISEIDVENGDKNKISVVTVEGYKIPILKGEIDLYKVEYNLPDKLIAPVEINNVIGNVKVYYNDEEIFSEDLYAIDESKNINIKYLLESIINEWYYLN